MQKQYRHLFFDLDHTIWDFESNAKESIFEIFDDLSLGEKGIEDKEAFYASYRTHNAKLWDRYIKGYIRQDELKWKRMWLALLDHKIGDENLSKIMSELYVNVLPTKTILFPGAQELLQKLYSSGLRLHLITNGFEAVQHKKLENSNIGHFFLNVITSERCGATKPNKEIFNYAFKAAGAFPEESVMIGDNLDADIQGGINAGVDTVFVNHVGEPAPHVKATFEVPDLPSLEHIFFTIP